MPGRRLKNCVECLGENLIHLLPHSLTPRRFEIAHRAFHIRVTKATAAQFEDRLPPRDTASRMWL